MEGSPQALTLIKMPAAKVPGLGRLCVWETKNKIVTILSLLLEQKTSESWRFLLGSPDFTVGKGGRKVRAS